MFVPAYQVFAFNFVKRHVISALWYAALVHLLFEPFSTAAILISSAFIAISLWEIRFYMAIASPVPMIASVILSYLHYQSVFPYIAIAGCIWLILCIIALIVTLRLNKNIYYIDPVTNIMYKT